MTAKAQLLHGQMLAAAGQKDKALQNMLNAKKTFVKLGLKRLEREVEPQISQMKDNNSRYAVDLSRRPPIPLLGGVGGGLLTRKHREGCHPPLAPPKRGIAETLRNMRQ